MAKKHTWTEGDNLFALAKKYGTTSAEILEANPGFRSPYPGVVLTIPGATQTTTTGGVDPYGGYTPSPGVPAPYVPPVTTTPTTGGSWGYDPTPPPAQPIVQQPIVPPVIPQQPLEPSRVGLPTLPPLEPSRVGQVPQAPPPSMGVQPGTPQATAVNYLNRLFNIQPGVFQQQQQQAPPLEPSRVGGGPSYWQQVLRGNWSALGPAINQTGRQVNKFFGHYGPPRPSARGPQLEPSRVGGVPSPTTFGQLVAQGMDPTEAAKAIASGQFAPPTVGTMGAQGFPDLEGPTPLRSSIIDYYLDNGLLPAIFFREDIARLGITEAELLAAGYVKDQFGDWIRGGQTPGEVERVVEGGAGTGSGGAYPRRGGGGAGGGYGYPGYGGGFGGIEINFPESGQSFVTQQQRGVSPTGRSVRPARMGAVSWRI